MSAERLEIHSTFEPVAGEWDALVDRTAAGPFARPGWYQAWWDAFGQGDLEIAVLRRGVDVAAVLPLHVRRGARRSLTNWHTPELAIPADDHAARAALLAGVLGGSRLPVTLSILTAGRPEAAAVPAAAAASGMRLLLHVAERSPYVALDGDWETYAAGLPRRRRSELRRRRRRLEELGAVTFEVADGTERLEPLLREGYGVEGSGWKLQEGTAIVSSPETERFYSAVARWAAARGTLRLGFLRVDGRAVAFHLTLEESGVAYLLKGGYDPELRALSPGQLLIGEMLHWAFGRGLRTYEFLGAEEDFKRDWTSDLRDRLTARAFPRSAAGSVGFAAYAYGRPVAKRARELVASR